MAYRHDQRVTYTCDTPGCKGSLVVVNKYLPQANQELRAKGWGRALRAIDGGRDYLVVHYCPTCVRAKQKGAK